MISSSYCAIYDFELFPYALGDVLTWNIQTAICCEESGAGQVDIFICLDSRYPASVFQKNLIVAENCYLHFNELFSAFGTHPNLGNIFIFMNRDQLLERLNDLAMDNISVKKTLDEYRQILSERDSEDARVAYFMNYIYSHNRINQFMAKQGRIPFLKPSRGCEPDVEGLVSKVFPGKRIVIVHPRLQRLDVGRGGEHTYSRDSEFLEWYEFIRTAGNLHPEVQFVVPGRQQEKPLELLKLPNILSLRSMGLGLGHELTLILESDLFIGTSSGFAAMANFSNVPYFITHMNKESCKAYQIKFGSDRLPFASSEQILVYEQETSEMLMALLERGLSRPARYGEERGPKRSLEINVGSFEQERSKWLYPFATTSRFFVDDTTADQESAYLLWPKVRDALNSVEQGTGTEQARKIVRRIEINFPRLNKRFPELITLNTALSHNNGAKAFGRVLRVRQKLFTIISYLNLNGVSHLVSRAKRMLGKIVRSSRRGSLLRDILHRIKIMKMRGIW